jgi:hypothetical protein
LEVPDVPSSVLIAEKWLAALQANLHVERLTPERRRLVEQRNPERHARTMLHLLRAA